MNTLDQQIALQLTVNQFNLITDNKDLRLATGQFKTRNRSQQAQAHRLLLSAGYHYILHGDTRPFARIIDSFTQGMRKNKAILWCVEKFNLEYITHDEHGKKLSKPVFKKNGTKPDTLQDAASVPFWNLKTKISEDEEFDMTKWGSSFQSMIVKAIEAGQVVDMQVMQEQLIKARVKANDGVYFLGTGVQHYIDHGNTRTFEALPAMLQEQAS